MGRTRQGDDAALVRLWQKVKPAVGWAAWVLLLVAIYVGVRESKDERVYQHLKIIDAPADVQADALANETDDEPRTFHGYECSDDCSGHAAGYEWALDRDIKSRSDCPDASTSFQEGCWAWADEQPSN